VVYGHVLGEDSSILGIIPAGWIRQTAMALISLHVLFSFIIIANPVNQEIESLFNVPNRFTWKRIVIRTFYMCLVIFGSESLPSFGMILDLIGGTTVAAMCFIFPGWFYLALRFRTKVARTKCDIPIRWWEWPLNILVIGVGVLGGVASMYGAITTVMERGDQFKLPCYLGGGD